MKNMSCDREENVLKPHTIYRRLTDFNYLNRFSLKPEKCYLIKNFLCTEMKTSLQI